MSGVLVDARHNFIMRVDKINFILLLVIIALIIRASVIISMSDKPEYCYGAVYDYVNDSILITGRIEKIRQELADEGKIVTFVNSFPNYTESIVYNNQGKISFTNKIVYDFTIVVLFKCEME